jgi:threonine dehydrogenase-like Zn-dependent dehydrogenase
MLRAVRRPLPEPGRAEWVRLRSRLSGICGSDLSLITASDSPSLEPTVSTPFVPGHESVAVVEDAGAANLKPGARVVMDAVLHCAIRGISPVCRSCAAGRFSLCENFLDGCVSPGLFAGYNRDLGGAWGERFFAHRDMLFEVPANVSDEEAVLLEPFCSALHPVISRPPRPGDRVVVLGCGTLGLLTIAALRATGFAGTVIAAAKYDFQAEIAKSFGANTVIPPGRAMLKQVAESTGARYLQGTLGPPMLLGGPETVYDCVGSSSTVQTALQAARAGGRAVIIGISAQLKIDPSCLWFKEVELTGSCGSGGEVPGRPGVRTMQYAIELAAAGKVKLGGLITHTFRAENYKAALKAALGKSRRRSLKVVFDFR